MHLFGRPLDEETPRQRLEWKLWLAAAALIVAGSLTAWMFLIAHGDQTHFAVQANLPAAHVAPRTFQAGPPPIFQRLLPVWGTAPETPAQSGIVWVNTASGIYHYPGTRWYGRTAQGKYLGEVEALVEGDRAAKNERRPSNFNEVVTPMREFERPSSTTAATVAVERPRATSPLTALLPARIPTNSDPTREPTIAATSENSSAVEPNEQLSVCVQAIAAQSDPGKLATLGERGANPRLKRIMYYLAQARAGGADPAEVIDQAQRQNGSTDTPRAALVKASLLRNLKICDGLGLLTRQNMAGLRRGQAPVVTRGPYTGQVAEVDHIVPLAYAVEIGNELANLEMLPASLNRAKSAKVGERQLALAEKFQAAGLISEATMAVIQSKFRPSGTVKFELPEQ